MTGLVLLALVAASTEAPTLASDRPGFSYAAGVTPPGRWVTSLGARGRFGSGADGYDLPVVAARLGLLPHVELTMALPGYSSTDGGPSGLGNLAFGAKVGGELREWLAASLVGLAVLPVGDPEVADPEAQAVLAANVELYFLGDGWVSLNTQLDSFTGDDGRVLAVTPSAALGWTLIDRLNPFAQTYLRFAQGDVVPVVGVGIGWLVTPRVQIDVSTGFDLDAEMIIVDGGVAVLW